jgi:hypothetical protein
MALRFALCLLTVAAGCAVPERAQLPAPEDAVVGETVQASRAPLAEQRTTLSRAEQAFASDASAVNRLRLAALLGTLPDPLRDDTRALELLRPLADAGMPGAPRLAALLAAQVAERQRLARELERAARERERSDRERDKREEALRQQADALKEQVEALRAIERGIREREEKLRRRQN